MAAVDHGINVCECIVPGGHCSGCGACAGICRGAMGYGALTMEWGEDGAYRPRLDPGRCRECGMCLKVCPFINENPDTDVMAAEQFAPANTFDPVLGRYDGLFAGYSKAHREQGAGGGITTWFLETLLAKGVVDKVACVLPTGDPDRLFRFVVTDDIATVRRGGKSAYYPVEISQVVAEMAQTDDRFAVVGLPCVIRALQLAARTFPALRKGVAFTVGLTCGQARSRYFAEYLCALSGGHPDLVSRAAFRVKDPGRHHLDHRFECAGDGFNCSIYQTEGMGWLWGHDCFKMSACNYCDDITAELADITFADAIDEPYCHGNGGANFVITRTGMAHELLRKGAANGELVLDGAPVEALRHRMEGVELVKRRDFRHRLHLRRDHTEYVAAGRQKAEARRDERENDWMALRDLLREATTATYAAHRHSPDCVDAVQAAIDKIVAKNGGDWT